MHGIPGIGWVFDEIRKWVPSSPQGETSQLANVTESLQAYQDQALAVAREGVRSVRTSVAHMEQATAEQLVEVKAALTVAQEQYQTYETIFFDHLKRGVFWAADNKVAASGLGLVALLFTLRAPRKYIYNVTFGRFQSVEAKIESAERQVEQIKQTVDVLKNDSQKLQERAQMAEAEFLSGRAKLRATGAELRRLLAGVRSANEQTACLRDSLRELPTRDSIRLRADLATSAKEARQQLQLLDSKMSSLARLGVYV